MCCCGKPVKNGEPGYKWQPGDVPSVRQPNPPALTCEDVLLYDEPGRCGGLDSHCHHFRVVKARWGGYCLLVKHGGGEERIELGSRPGVKFLEVLDSDGRYWALQMLYHVQERAAREASDKEAHRWRAAIADGRAKKRRYPKRGHTKVWIEDGPRVFDVEGR